ncbi:MAG: M48 family metalloprotease [Pseudomonadota bacterium]
MARTVLRAMLCGAFAAVLAACGDAPAAADTPLAQSTPPPAPARQGAERYAAFAAVVERHRAMSDRVSRISRTLRVANAPLCAVTRPDVGISTHRLQDYPEGLRPLALHFMDLGEEGRFVRSVVPGSPAARAALLPGARILSGWPVRRDAALVTEDGPVALRPDTACVAPTFVIDAPRPNAGTDGREIELTTALVESVPDDAALAFIIAHEMAHVLRGHTPAALSGRDARWRAELQADADALILLRNAGYDVAATVAGWEAGMAANRESQALSFTHPPLDIRRVNLEDALARLGSEPEGFRPLED